MGEAVTTYGQPRCKMTDVDCEDQGMMATDHCTLFRCQTWLGSRRIMPTLVNRDGDWCCPKCGASYGRDARQSACS
jgi:hypothetical protein